MSKFLKMKELIAEMNLPDYRYKQLLDAVFRQHTYYNTTFKDFKSVYNFSLTFFSESPYPHIGIP